MSTIRGADSLISEPYHRLRINQNRFYHLEEEPLTSVSHAELNMPRKSRERWGIKNLETGARTTHLLNFAFIFGVIQSWFENFQDLENSFLARMLTKIFCTASTVAEAERDKQMYEEIYAMGIDGNLNHSEILNQADAINSEKIIGSDDILENMREEKLYGESIIPKAGKLATSAAKIKPVTALIGGLFLNDGLRNALNSILDMPARGYWRGRFFSSSLHANFVTTWVDLIKLSAKSVFSDSGRQELNKLLKTLGDNSKQYFQSKYNGSYMSDTKSPLSMYFSMLKDRMIEHFNAIRDPKQALEEKCKRGFLHEVDSATRRPNPDRTIDRGYADPENSNDQAYQKRVAIVDFTAPFCALFGLLGAFVFDPIKIAMGAFKIEKGINVVSALSSSRKSWQNLNYIFRFMLPELSAGSSYKDLEKIIREGNPSEAVKQFYASKKRRYINGWIGLLVAAGSIFEPLGHLFKYKFEDSRLYKFLFDSLVHFNDDGFLGFFTMRRRCMGEEAFLRSYIEEKKGIPGTVHIDVEDFKRLPDSYDEFIEHARARMEGVSRKRGVFTPVLDKLSDAWDRLDLDGVGFGKLHAI